MWTRLAHFIIKYRLPLVILIGLVTIFMGYHAKDAEMSYDFRGTVPANDPEQIFFSKFRKQFGEDGNIVAVGLKDSAIYRYENFERLRQFCAEVKGMAGVNDVISLPLIKKIEKDTANTRFVLTDVFPGKINSQAQLDSLLQEAKKQKFYIGQIVNEKNGAIAILVSIKKEVLNSPKRIGLTDEIIDAGKTFSAQTGIALHYAGLPFVRSVIASKVGQELKIFLMVSVVITGIILLVFFRSFRAVIFPLIVIGIIVIWVLGSIALFGFKISLLSGMIPPIIVVIGIPNAIYLMNKYHTEFAAHGNKVLAISRVVRKVGLATFMTNLTTAIGFLVLLTADITILREFGIVAGLNVMATFVVSLILIPGVFSWMPPPSAKHLKHLDVKVFDKALNAVDLVVHRHRTVIYSVAAALVVFAVIGMSRLHSISFMVDDLPAESVVKRDLAFFEENFSGVMPLEIVLNTGKKRGVIDVKNLRKIDEFEQFLASQKDISKPVSLVSFVKAAKQAFYNNNPARYALPDNRERAFILRYMKGQSDSSGLFKSFVDEDMQTMRISMQVADIGSDKMDSLVNQVIQPGIDSLFANTGMTATITGTTPLFIKGNKFLIANLRGSLLLAFALIAITMGLLFANLRMIVISLVPNFIPMMITAAIMGYFGIPLKPSTVLIFSITFGISVDYSIHFLAKYRQELHATGFFVPVAISNSILEVGKSMVYTSIVLFCGFIIFTFSSFGGTIALGVLTSTTLMISMVTNLVLLPSLIMTFDKRSYTKGGHALIDEFDPGSLPKAEDDLVDLDKMKIHDKEGATKQGP
ncbi:MAG: MMPL family transporter [Cyclobacteriaceae bacterium]|nr:MMPL family transporter [Cyclobacteriaceae bacterium]MCB0499553.1 MMPL family transporter [Cyclobacteriaceae bacterium]MCB9238133.1 MMPL family transporter [Flammeovirgaceae bacterium]MCO5273006.1 MMPL family transporter [Cyclobacteriaceae bacterium]MCW5901543.1 MMPL family transporter [Cyclobacteriaceae bacterium]